LSSLKQILLEHSNSTPLSWYLATFQRFFAAFFKDLASITIREMWRLESRSWSRTSRPRSRLLWQSLGLEVRARSQSRYRRLRSRLHHWCLHQR